MAGRKSASEQPSDYDIFRADSFGGKLGNPLGRRTRSFWETAPTVFDRDRIGGANLAVDLTHFYNTICEKLLLKIAKICVLSGIQFEA
jgi:hypothetical protein